MVRFTFGGPEIARVRTLAPDQRVKLLFPPPTAACRNFQPRATGADRCAASSAPPPAHAHLYHPRPAPRSRRSGH
ncbi:siderophore-interacting protein [Pseudomonas aeruginosa]